MKHVLINGVIVNTEEVKGGAAVEGHEGPFTTVPAGVRLEYRHGGSVLIPDATPEQVLAVLNGDPF